MSADPSPSRRPSTSPTAARALADQRRRPRTLDKLRQRVWATRTMLLMRLRRGR